MHTQKTIETLHSPINQHGEGPIWHMGRQSVFWVDILSDQILEYNWNQKQVYTYSNAKMVSAIFEIEGQNDFLMATIQGGLAEYDLNKNSCIVFNDLDRDWKETRCNDGAVDPDGNIWFSTTHIDHEEGAGDLFCLKPNGEIIKILEKVSISNGPCWTPIGNNMYHTDSGSRIIKEYNQYNNEWRATSRQIQISENLGFPDGMAMDLNGVLWVAIWGGFAVVGYDTDTGKMVAKIDLPVPHVSSCAFVGPNLDTLFITSSRKGLTDTELEKYPDSGKVFMVQMDSKGMEMKTFNKKF